MVQKLRQAQVSQKEIKGLTGISDRTIRRIEKEPAVTTPNDEALRQSRKVGRPSKVNQYEDLIRQWLEEERAPEDGPIQSQEILARLRTSGYTGGKSSVYELVRRLRPKKVPKPIVRFEGLPGEFSQHDFGQRRVTYTDGSQDLIRFFASRLKYSRFVDIQVVENEQQETVVRCLLKAFENFGGVPLMGVFDNMSSAVKSREVNPDGTVHVQWTERFGQACMDCSLIPLACWPYRPQQKGSVENLVGFVKNNFFCGRKFENREDVIRQLQNWVNTVNDERICDATGEIPRSRLVRESLQPCQQNAQSYPFKVSVVVRPTARAHYRGLEYSVPAETIGQTVTLHLQQSRVQIYLGEQHLAEHPRFPDNGKSSILPHHAEQLFQFRRGKPYAQRQLLLDLDPMVEPYLTELVHRCPLGWEAHVDSLYQLYQQIGRSEFLVAIALASENRSFGSEYVIHIADVERTESNAMSPST